MGTANAGGSGSPCSKQDSAILRATSRAISITSKMERPSASNPGTSGLVARYPPSSNGSTCNRMVASDIWNHLTESIAYFFQGWSEQNDPRATTQLLRHVSRGVEEVDVGV